MDKNHRPRPLSRDHIELNQSVPNYLKSGNKLCSVVSLAADWCRKMRLESNSKTPPLQSVGDPFKAREAIYVPFYRLPQIHVRNKAWSGEEQQRSSRWCKETINGMVDLEGRRDSAYFLICWRNSIKTGILCLAWRIARVVGHLVYSTPPHVAVCPSSGTITAIRVRTLRCIIMTKIIAHKLICKESLEVHKHGHVPERKEELWRERPQRSCTVRMVTGLKVKGRRTFPLGLQGDWLWFIVHASPVGLCIPLGQYYLGSSTFSPVMWRRMAVKWILAREVK